MKPGGWWYMVKEAVVIAIILIAIGGFAVSVGLLLHRYASVRETASVKCPACGTELELKKKERPCLRLTP